MAMRCAPTIKVTNAFAKSSNILSVKKFCSRYPSKNANKSRKIYAKKAKLIMPKNPCKSWMSMNKPSNKHGKKPIY